MIRLVLLVVVLYILISILMYGMSKMGQKDPDRAVWGAIIECVIKTREAVMETHNMNKHKDFSGLCYDASNIFCDMITRHPINTDGFLKAEIIHGEMMHSPKIPSKYWTMEHTMVVVSAHKQHQVLYEIWVDCTAQQFKWLIPYEGEFYVNTKKPKWFYPDRMNPAWSGIGCAINKSNSPDAGGHIIETLQYDVWGKISDWIRKILRYKDVEEGDIA